MLTTQTKSDHVVVTCSVCSESWEYAATAACCSCGTLKIAYDVGDEPGTELCERCITRGGDGIGHANVCEGSRASA